MEEKREATQRRALIHITPELFARLGQPRILLAVAFFVAGVVAEVLGYRGASGTIDPGEQLPYIISGGIGGVFLLGTAAALFFTGDLQALKSQMKESLELNRQLSEQIGELREQLHALVPHDAQWAGPPVTPPEATGEFSGSRRRSSRRA